jgi:organic hydroperoxide reductase OsmC/OhrA
MHEYHTMCRWKGSTGPGYEAYDRTHSAETDPPTTSLTLSSDPAFHGNRELLDPEQLFVVSASSCQLLSFLAVAARARIDVVEYEDDARGVMPDEPRPMRVTEIVLRPRIVVRGGATEARIRHLCDVAHRECFIANSVTTEIRVEPTIEFVT